MFTAHACCVPWFANSGANSLWARLAWLSSDLPGGLQGHVHAALVRIAALAACTRQRAHTMRQRGASSLPEPAEASCENDGLRHPHEAGQIWCLLHSQAVSLFRLYCIHIMVDLDLLLAACAHLPGSTYFIILQSMPLCARTARKHKQAGMCCMRLCGPVRANKSLAHH